MARVERLTVYCGSSPKAGIEYIGSAREFGREMAKRGTTLVYGGANIRADGGAR